MFNAPISKMRTPLDLRQRVARSFKWLLSATLLLLLLLSSSAVAAKLEVLYEFDGSVGCDPTGGVVVDSTGIANGIPGTIYGTAKYCGSTGGGAVFSLTPPPDGKGHWKLEPIYQFQGEADGSRPGTGLVMETMDPYKGVLYGTTELGATFCNCGTIFTLTPPPGGTGDWSFHKLAEFPGAPMATPNSTPILVNGLLFGTTAGGAGAVYKQFPDGRGPINQYAYNSDGSGAFGGQPQGVVFNNKDQKLYGTAFSGGADGDGTVFVLTTRRHGHLVHSFGTSSGDGISPLTAPIIDASGQNLYGTTWRGGNTNDCPSSPGCGTVWRLTRRSPTSLFWKLKVLHSFAFFTHNRDGQTPMSRLLLDPATGTLYGTTFYGGTGTQCGGNQGDCGTVFEVSSGGGGYRVLWDFPNNGGDPANCRGGACPAAPEGDLALFNGALYGTSYDGGKQCGGGHYLGCGTVWKLTP